MDSPKRKMQKRQDYHRHKFFRKLAKRKKAAKERESKAAEKELTRRLKMTPPKYGDGKTPEGFSFMDTIDSVADGNRLAQDFVEQALGMVRQIIQKGAQKDFLKRVKSAKSDPIAKNIIKKSLAKTENDLIRSDVESNYPYIGGTTQQARQRYFDLDEEFADSTRSIAAQYNLPANMLASRIAKEGPIDDLVKSNNMSALGQGRKNMHPRALRDAEFGIEWGLDDFYTNISEDKLKIRQPIMYMDTEDENEHGRTVYSAEFIPSDNRNTWSLAMHATAAELEYRKTEMKKLYPNADDETLNSMALAAFNRGISGARKFINAGGNVKATYPTNYIKLKHHDDGKLPTGPHYVDEALMLQPIIQQGDPNQEYNTAKWKTLNAVDAVMRFAPFYEVAKMIVNGDMYNAVKEFTSEESETITKKADEKALKKSWDTSFDKLSSEKALKAARLYRVGRKMLPKLIKGAGLFGAIVDTPGFVSNIENLKRSFGLKYRQGLIQE